MSDDIVAELDRWLRGSGIGQFAEILPEVVQRARDELVLREKQMGEYAARAEHDRIAVRAEALEEAARVCETHDPSRETRNCAAAIRALQGKADG
jgi:hypothetical protein